LRSIRFLYTFGFIDLYPQVNCRLLIKDSLSAKTKTERAKDVTRKREGGIKREENYTKR